MSDIRMQRYSADAVRIMLGDDVVGMLSRHCDDMWSINDRNENRLHRRRFLTARAAFVYAKTMPEFARGIPTEGGDACGSVHG